MAKHTVVTLSPEIWALTRPSDLWIVPTPERSQWFAQIDWYLNWQMSKGRNHSKMKPSAELFRILEEGGMQYQEVSSENQAPLLVLSAGRIPTEKCVVIESPAPLKGWLKDAAGLAQNLNAQRVHIFLPSEFERKDVELAWKNLPTKDIDVEFSLDEDAL